MTTSPAKEDRSALLLDPSNHTVSTSSATSISSRALSSSLKHSCKMSNGQGSKKKGTVSFHSVQIREYPRIVSDNPSVSSGPPLGIGWKHLEDRERNFPFDAYEKCRTGLRRELHEMKMPPDIRLETLREWGISTSEIRRAQKECVEIKRQRMETIKKDQNIFACMGKNCAAAVVMKT